MRIAHSEGGSGGEIRLPSRFQAVCFIAGAYGCDIAIPNATGIGDVLMYTRVVEELGMRNGHPLDILTGRMAPVDVGTVGHEEPYPIWKENPFVGKIVDAGAIAPDVLRDINSVHETHCQFGHMIANICAEYGVVPRTLRPSLYLSLDERQQALATLAALPRPVLCIHPYGTSSPRETHAWYRDEWLRLLAEMPKGISVVEVGLHAKEDKKLPTTRFETTLRQMMAIVWASDMFMGFDSSVAHVATAFSKPALVLWDPVRKNELDERFHPGFGPAAYARWSYRENNNLMLLGETNGEIRRQALGWIGEVCRSIGAHV